MTMKEIAKLAGVSTATVSNVLNHNHARVSKEMRQKILKIMRDMDYVPNNVAKSLRKQQTNTIGILTEDIRHFQTPSIITGISTYMDKIGKHILLYDMAVMRKIGGNPNRMHELRDDIDGALNILLAAQVDGIVYVAFQDRDISDLVRHIGVPLVYAYCYSDLDERCWVSYDNIRIMREIMSKIIALGHRKIAVVWGGEGFRPAQQRLDAYMETIKQNGIPYREEYICHGDWSFDDGVRLYKYYMSLADPPTALIFMNDEMAAGAIIESMRSDRKILDAVSVVGFNDMEYARFFDPGLTTVKLPLEEIGSRSAELLVRMLENEEIPAEQIVLNCQMIERSSLRKNTMK